MTLSQGNRAVTKITEFQCWGDDDITIPFRGFHPGLATIDATLTACDAENLTDCRHDEGRNRDRIRHPTLNDVLPMALIDRLARR